MSNYAIVLLNIEEGIPVDGLLDYLREEIHRVKSDTSIRDEDKDRMLKELIRQGYALYHNSAASSDRVESGDPAVDDTQPFFRAQAEAQYIFRDLLRNTGDDTANFYAGLNAMRRRRNLNFSGVSGAVPSPAPPSTPPPAPGPRPDTGPAPSPEPVPDTTPAPIRLEDLRRKAGVINRSLDIRKRATELAEEKLREEMKRGHALNPLNWVRKIRLRILEDYYRQQYRERAIEAMIANNNSYLTMDVVGNAAVNATYRIAEEREAGKAKLEQVKGDIRLAGEEVLTVGPLRDLMMSEIFKPLVEELKAGHTITEADMQQRLRDFITRNENNAAVRADFDRVFGRTATQYGALADYFATDFLEVGRQMVVDHNAHHFSIDELLSVTDIVLANTSWAAESKANFNASDRAIAWIERHRLSGVLINPLTVGAAFSLGTFGLLKLPGVAARVAGVIPPVAAPPLVGGLAGGLLAAFRRSYDLKVDRAAHMAEMTYGVIIPANARRREALERFAYNTASVNELLNGGGQDAVLARARRSIAELKSDLSNQANRDELISRILEIKARLDYSATNKVDLIIFGGREQVEQSRLVLVKAIVEARQALRSAGYSDVRIDILEAANNPSLQQWNDIFKSDQQTRDRAFRNYRFREAVKAAGIGFVTGVAGGLISQEGWKLIREAGGAVVGLTAGEQAVNAGARLIGAKEVFQEKISVETFKNLYSQGGMVDLGNKLRADIDPAAHTVKFFDTGGANPQPLADVPPTYVEADGHLVVAGDIKNLHPQVDKVLSQFQPISETDRYSAIATIKKIVGGFGQETIKRGNLEINISNTTPGRNIADVLILDTTNGQRISGLTDSSGSITLQAEEPQLAQLKSLHTALQKEGFQVNNIIDAPTRTESILSKVFKTINDGRKESFRQGTIDFTVDGKTGTVTLVDAAGQKLQGIIDKAGKLTLDSTKNPSGINYDNLAATLKAAGFKDVDLIKAPGTASSGSLIDQLINKPPDVLKKMGILQSFSEKDPHPKTWNWHVLRPDIVTATGQHTHNELTLHIGQFMDPQGKWQTGQVGVLNFAGEIRAGKPIPSHLLGVPPAFDHILNTLVERSGPISFRDMVYVIDLNDGNQIMVRSDDFGNVMLPQELFDRSQWLADPSHPEKALRGLKSIASAVLEGKDGKVLKTDEILDQGLPKGSVTVHSLASVAYTTPTPPSPPPVPGRSLLSTKPSDLTELIHHYSLATTPPSAFDFAPPTVEDPFGIATPFAPRYPLETLGRILPYSAIRELFLRPDGSPATFRDIVRFHNRTSTQSGTDSSSGERASSTVKEAFRRTPHIYINLAGSIGDVVLDSAYIEGIRQYSEKLGGGKKITLVAPTHIVSILKPYTDKYGLEVVSEARYQGVEKIKTLIQQSKENDALVLEFEHHSGRPAVEILPNNNVVVRDLFLSSVGLYGFDRSGDKRFSDYLADLLSIPKNEKLDIQPYVVLPADADQIYADMVRKYAIDSSKKQIAIVIEASHKMKRYSLAQWREVITKIRQQNAGIEFNIIFNPGASYSEAEVKSAFDAVPGAKLVTEDLSKISSLLVHQDAVLSNDTGLAHLAGVVEKDGKGPQVISLHLPIFSPNIWCGNRKRHLGLLPSQTLLTGQFDSEEADESTKWINKITPDEVAHEALKALIT